MLFFITFCVLHPDCKITNDLIECVHVCVYECACALDSSQEVTVTDDGYCGEGFEATQQNKYTSVNPTEMLNDHSQLLFTFFF